MALRPGEWRAALRRVSQSIYRATGERDACPACQSQNIFELDVLPLRAARTGFVSACHGCGLVFSNPLPTSQELAEFYSQSGTWAADRRGQPEVPADRVVRARGSWSRMFDLIRGEINVTSPPRGAAVLDFGCGEGKLLDSFQACGWATYGIEPALDVAFRRHRRLDGVPDVPQFDLILLIQVLEHVANPLQLLRQLARASKIGGHIVIVVPRFDTLPIHRDYRYVLNGRAHITAYTWPCLRTLLARAGWEPVAPPPAEVSRGGGGRLTTSRLRVLARRVTGTVLDAGRPANAARAAVRQYYASGASCPLLARAGLLRLAARQAHQGRRRDVRKDPAARRTVASSSEP